ncbi:alpha/beta hydrolase [Pseudonocardia acaciae]|uniref:alpha/beta hydrolase n=1 Tax=Pseudonocardia acaciae TaxID=551276 RepID=UPI00316AD521
MPMSHVTGVRLAVLLPGTGSDEVFVTAAFGGPLRALGIPLLAPAPSPGVGVVDGYLRALDRAAQGGDGLLVGGVSLGAQVAARWAAASSSGLRLAGLLLALPAWTGPPGAAPAATAAAASAAALRRDGLAATIETTRARTPEWLGTELARAWRRHGDGLACSLEAAAAAVGPTEAELAGLRVPVGLAGLRDDPVHPLAVAQHWHDLTPRSALVTSTLAALGRDRASIGRASVLAWLRARALA